MIEPEISLAFSVHSKKGTYALLLGSGVSRAAGIPTGWEIVLDLIKKLAATNGEDCSADPETWFVNKYNEEPDYSNILEYFSKSPTTRSQILRPYFEPNDEEREENLKMPTQAHKSIANLVKEGYVKVILTTNFDRLLEQALEQVGIRPSVISTQDSIKGAPPLPHTDCLMIKLHGDYLDARIKNSPKELASYNSELKKLLDRILSEYGLIICGWSADWDTALVSAFERCKNHRFQTFWTSKDEPKANAERLINLRKAEIIKIKGADTFFKDLEEKVISIQEFNRPHPLSTQTAIATIKRLLRDRSQDIRLHDFVTELVEDTYNNLSPDNFPIKKNDAPISEDTLISRVKIYESYVERLLNVMIAGCYWGDESTTNLWVKGLQRIANSSGDGEGSLLWINLRLYPALLLFYGACLGSILSNNFQCFASLIHHVWVRLGIEEENLFYYMHEHNKEPINNDAAQILIGGEKMVAPLSIYLFEKLREPFREYLTSEIEYQKAFDRFEYLLALIYFDQGLKKTQHYTDGPHVWGPVGMFAFRGAYNEHDYHFVNANISVKITEEVVRDRDNWPPLKAGLFDGSAERFEKVKAQYDGFVSKAYSARHPVL